MVNKFQQKRKTNGTNENKIRIREQTTVGNQFKESIPFNIGRG